MRLCGKTPINWFPNQVRSERGSSTRFFCPQFDRLKGPWWSRSAHDCKSITKVSFEYTPRFASIPRMAILIFAIFQVSGFDFCPKMKTLSLRPLCALMNFMDCTNIPQNPQQGSQSMLTLIQRNNSDNFEHSVSTICDFHNAKTKIPVYACTSTQPKSSSH